MSDIGHVCPIQAAVADGGFIGGEAWCWAHFKSVASTQTAAVTEQSVTRPDLRLTGDGRVAIYYAPVDSVNTRARLALVGITPGRQQAALAWTAALEALGEGCSDDEVLHHAKRTAAFGGSMRRNLVEMLDVLGVAQHLELESCSELFTTHNHLLQSTSAVLYPAFVDGQNYGGHSPGLNEHPDLRAFSEHVLGADLRLTPDALVVPLGVAAGRAVERLVEVGMVSESRCLLGLPHPSGGNGHRVRQFRARQVELRESVLRWS